MATDSAMTHYCDWAISILIQQAGYARQAPLWEALSWLHAGSALFAVASRPSAPPQSTAGCIYLHPLLKIKSHYCGCAARAANAALPYSAEAKNIPSDVVVMQQARVIGTSEKSPHSGFEMRWPAYIARNSVRGNFELLVYKKKRNFKYVLHQEKTQI